MTCARIAAVCVEGVIRDSVLVAVMDWERRGRWVRTFDRDRLRFPVRYYVSVAGRRLRVPWLAWAMFS